MTLTVVSVAYPLAPVGPDAVGGAEQVLTQLDTALVVAGHRSVVVACEGSVTAGELVTVPRVTGELNESAVAEARRCLAARLREVLARIDADLVHMHGVDFHAYLPPPGPPVLASLHLPVAWYPPEALRPLRPLTWLHCVSRSQHRDCGANPFLIPPIENGVKVDKNPPPHAKRRFALLLSRICPEKGVHLAIEAAKQAGMPLLIGGEVFPYPAHQSYFQQEVAPRLDTKRRYLGPVGLIRKRRLLAAARCVLIPSLVAETSSLVAREAMAAGTPVVAFRRGALVEIVEHGSTGFLVDDVAGMARGIVAARDLDPQACRQVARERFSLASMMEAYLAAYQELARIGRHARLRGAA